MINVGDGTIAIAAGDCGILALEIRTVDGTYTMAETDTVELTVREKPNADSPVVLHVVGAPWGATNATINYNYTGGDT